MSITISLWGPWVSGQSQMGLLWTLCGSVKDMSSVQEAPTTRTQPQDDWYEPWNTAPSWGDMFPFYYDETWENQMAVVFGDLKDFSVVGWRDALVSQCLLWKQEGVWFPELMKKVGCGGAAPQSLLASQSSQSKRPQDCEKLSKKANEQKIRLDGA